MQIKPKNSRTNEPGHKKSLGQRGEDLAALALMREGYRIIERNFRTRQGEIDIVAEDGGEVCFVEVKARSTDEFGTPEEAVTARKQQKLAAAALCYIARRAITAPSRFDVVSVNLKTGQATIHKNAFELRD
ncbi:MAG: YraN family protein [Deltaproteobacteria bacterium]